MSCNRAQSYDRYMSGLSKIAFAFEHLQDAEGTMRQAFDALFVYTEQELQQSRQQAALGELRKQVTEVREDTERKLAEYAREVQNLAKDVAASEKKLNKSKDALSKALEAKTKMDAKDVMREQRKVTTEEESHYEFDNNGVKAKKQSVGTMLFAASIGGFDDKVQQVKSDLRAEKRKELKDQLLKAEKDVADDIRALLRAISNQDQMQLGLRRAYQHVDLRCKNTIRGALSAILDREEESTIARTETFSKLSVAVKGLDVEGDISEFIAQHVVDDIDGDGGSLILSSQALNILEDVMPKANRKTKRQSTKDSISSPSRGSSSSSTKEELDTDTNYDGNRQTEANADTEPDRSFPDPLIKDFCNLHLTRLFYAGVGNDDSEGTRERRKSIMASAFGSYLKDAVRAETESNGTKAPASGDTQAGTSAPTSPAQPKPPKPPRLPKPEQLLAGQAFTMPPANAFERLNGLTDLSPGSVLEHCRQYTLKSTVEDKMSRAYEESVEKSVCWLGECVRTQAGRDAFVTALNQFRSQKVDVGEAYYALAAVLWQTLDQCAGAVDIHTSKVIMMLSQTFYRMNVTDDSAPVKKSKRRGSANSARRGSNNLQSGDDAKDSDSEDEGEIKGRGVGVRKYLKELLTPHVIWKDGKFWEQVLWECAIEQLYTMPYDSPWYDLSASDRREAVRRVHNVVMSQVMAVEHSMLELGCTHELVREFVYRMCVIHQLSESQKQMLLAHLQSVADKEKEDEQIVETV